METEVEISTIDAFDLMYGKDDEPIRNFTTKFAYRINNVSFEEYNLRDGRVLKKYAFIDESNTRIIRKYYLIS